MRTRRPPAGVRGRVRSACPEWSPASGAGDRAAGQHGDSRPASTGSLAAVVESERYEEQLRRLTELQRRVCEAHADPSLGGAAGLAGLPTALQDVGTRLQRATDTSAR